MPSSSSPRKRKPGPKSVSPSAADKRLVTMAVSIGMTRQEIADAVAMPLRSLARTFAHELAIGRSQRLPANAVRLDKAADQGNVAAMKALQVMMERGRHSEMDASDPWAAMAASFAESSDDEDNLARNPDFGKMN